MINETKKETFKAKNMKSRPLSAKSTNISPNSSNIKKNYRPRSALPTRSKDNVQTNCTPKNLDSD